MHGGREEETDLASPPGKVKRPFLFVCLFCRSQRLFSSRQTARCQDPWFGEHNTDWILGPIAQLYTEKPCARESRPRVSTFQHSVYKVTMISQAEEGGACSGKWWEGVGTCPSAQASRDWAIQLSQRPCRWSGLQEYVFEECLPVALTGFLNSHRFLAFEICFHCSSPFSHKVSVQSLSRVRLCDPMNCSTPGLPVHHQLPGFTQIHLH